MLNVIQIAAQAFGELGLPVPSQVAGAYAAEGAQILALLNREGNDLADIEGGWPSLRGEQLITLVPGQQSYDFPTDILYYRESTAWDRSAHWRVGGPLSDVEWQQLRSGLTNIALVPSFRLFGGKLQFNPVPSNTDVIAFEYISRNWCVSAKGVPQPMFRDDTDIPLLPDDLFVLGLKWRILAARGFNYAEEKDTYERAVQRRVARASVSKVLNLTKRNAWHGISAPHVVILGPTQTTTVPSGTTGGTGTTGTGTGSGSTGSGGSSSANPVTSFSVNPAINTDGSPTVGEVATFYFGTIINGTIGATTLIRTDVLPNTSETLTTNSYAWSTPGFFKLRVYDSTGLVFADSDITNVVAAGVVAMSAPTLSFPAGRTAGTNPPQVVVSSLDDTIDLTTDSVVLEWDRNSTGTFVAAGTKTVALTLDMGTAGEFAITDLDTLAAGAIRFRAKFTRPSIGGAAAQESAYSALLSDTLAAHTLSPATTVWDPANKSTWANIDGTDPRKVTFLDNTPRAGIASDTTRTDERYFTINPLFKATTAGGASAFAPARLWIGIVPSNTTIANGTTPTGVLEFVWDGEAATNATNYWAVNDELTVHVTPHVGSTDGVVQFYRNGTLVSTVANPLTSYKISAASISNNSLQLNTGQTALSFTPSGTRWN